MQTPLFSPQEARTRATFLALMWSLSYPGRSYELPEEGQAAYLAIAQALLDLETSYYTPDAALAQSLAQTGARALSSQRAAYHFYPTLDEPLLPTVRQASIGTLLYPDQGATLIIGCTLGQGQTLRMSGPGIPMDVDQVVQVAGIPAGFWELRRQANRYPRGWDVLLVDTYRVLGLPRTTLVTLQAE